MAHRAFILSWLMIAVLPLAAAADSEDAKRQAETIFARSGIDRGIVVHVGCGDGRLTAALSRGGSNVVHGLTRQSSQLSAARQYLRDQQLYGTVSVMYWEGSALPYVDHLVNLLVLEDADPISLEEMMRVLVPGGVICQRTGSDWQTRVKPPRAGADQWTHYLYDASGNPLSHDRLVGPPRHLQWTAGPAHTRSHEYLSSIAAIVSSAGRLFYIVDDGPTGNLQGDPDWQVTARDANNGVILWKRSIEHWYPNLVGWTAAPIQLQRRLVAEGDHVYVTLGYHTPVTVLDAATGQTIRVLESPDGVDEIIVHEGVLIVAAKDVSDERLAEYQKMQERALRRGGPLHDRDTAQGVVGEFRQADNRAGRSIVAFDAGSGRELWRLSGDDVEELEPLSLRAVADRVYFHAGGALRCCELGSGKPLWTRKGSSPRAASQTLLAFWDRDAVSLRSAEDGTVLWTQTPVLESVRDVFIAQDSVWFGGFKPFDTGRKHSGSAWGPYFIIERDRKTGEILREIAPENPGHHQRCYLSKATERYILGGRRGTEFIDLDSGQYRWNSWARGVCRYGVMPANGLLYVPPHSCGCYITAKLIGFNAMSADRLEPSGQATWPTQRLEPGPALEQQEILAETPGDWPTYRGNPGRSSFTPVPVPSDLQVLWNVALDGPLTAPTAAGGKVFVARRDAHTLVALDGATGQKAWEFVADGRIDSPPTVHGGQALVGSRDGCVYSLRGSDGAMAWRFRAARDGQRISAHGQLESAWPVHGSVLVDNDRLYVTAGRSSYLDHGIDLFWLDPASGQVLQQTNLYSPDPDTGLQPPQYSANKLPGWRSDILVADADHVYLRDQAFDHDAVPVDRRVPHLFTLTDFLDDSWTHRSYWQFAAESSIATGCSGRDKDLIYGRLLVYDDTTVHGYGRRSVHWSNEFLDGDYHLYARPREGSKDLWSCSVPIRVQAMVRAGDTIFMAGPDAQSVLQGEAPPHDPPALLLAYSATDGSPLASYPLDSLPVFDGMAAAQGRLIVALADGSVVCFGKD